MLSTSLCFSSGYDEDVNPTVTNSFATAAFRFGHTLIQGFVHTMDNDYKTNSVMPISDVSGHSLMVVVMVVGVVTLVDEFSAE